MEFLLNLFLTLPPKLILPSIIVFGLILILNESKILIKLGFVTQKINNKTLILLFLLIVVPSLITSLILNASNLKRESLYKNKIAELENILPNYVKGVNTDSETQLNEQQSSEINNTNCDGWIYCTDFKNDIGLDNKYYKHTSDDPQKLILEGGPFPNPPLYFKDEVSPFYSFKLDVLPLNSEAANILVESKEMFQLFIGDNDYRSLAFLPWDKNESEFVRNKDTKIFLERDLKTPDVEPKTQLSLTITTSKKGNNAEAKFELTYKSVNGKTEIVTFTKVLNIPAADPNKFLTKVGTGMYRSKGNIPQAKFYLMRLKN